MKIKELLHKIQLDATDGLPGYVSWDDALASGDRSAPPANRTIDIDLAAIIYTSGSTGEPKGVMLTHRNIATATESIVETLRIMVEHGYRHMLVSDGGKPAGIVSIRDLMRAMILPDAPVAHEGRRGVIRTRAEDAVDTLRQG